MTNYNRGRDFEYVVRARLLLEGYWVMRAAGSKTKVDLIAVKVGQVLVVQCKRNGKIPPAERAEVRRIAAMIAGGIPLLAYKNKGKAAVLLDELTGDGPSDRIPFRTDEVAA